MPSEATKAAHGGVRRVRTRTLSNGRYQRIYVMRDGTVVVGETERKKGAPR